MNIAIITARSGSKGLKNKNILKIGGKELMVYTIDSALKSKIFDLVFVSTDSEEYAKIAEKNGATAQPLRKKELSKDETPTSAVIIDIIENFKLKDTDTITILQPTSPLRNEKHITEAMKIFESKSANNVVSMTKSDKSPYIINKLPKENNIENFLNTDDSQYRRQNDEYYYPNGAIYILNVGSYKKTKTFYNKNSYAYIMGKRDSIDIDDELDFNIAKLIIENDL